MAKPRGSRPRGRERLGVTVGRERREERAPPAANGGWFWPSEGSQGLVRGQEDHQQGERGDWAIRRGYDQCSSRLMQLDSVVVGCHG